MKSILKTILLLLLFSNIVKAQVSTAEWEALKDLYNATDGANWTNNTNWQTNIMNATDGSLVNNSCQGITVSGGHVTALNLYNNNVIGPLPASIGSLGEYGWDGWLGCYFINCPKDELTFLFMMQKNDSGTTPLTRKLRNIVFSACCE